MKVTIADDEARAASGRLSRLKSRLGKKGLLPYYVSDLVNIRYLTGFTGSHAFLVIDRDVSFFISDTRYEEYARSILPGGVEFVLQGREFLDSLRTVLRRQGGRSLFIEEHNVTMALYLQMKERLRGVKLVPGGNEVGLMRVVKDEGEIARVRKAAEIVDRCCEHLRGFVRPGMTEWDVSVEIECFFRTNGCRKSGFSSIVASGSGSSMPHYETSMTRKIEPGDPLLIDMGCEYMGYNSDLTRTLFVGRVNPALKKIYDIVRRAQEAAVAAVKPGVGTGVLDSIARGIIGDEGYGGYFGHGLGHGVGLEVHEMPAVKPGDTRLKKNMIITIEPGIYVPGLGGVRIEDTVLVTSRGFETLTNFPKDAMVIS